MKMNRRASDELVMPTTIRLILAVIAIIALVYLLVSLYGIFLSKTRVQQAKGQLDEILNTMKGMKEGEEKSFVLLSPQDYSLVAWPIFSGGTLPGFCESKGWTNCLCMCPYTDSFIGPSLIGACSDGGVCVQTGSPVSIGGSFLSINDLFKNGYTTYIKFNGGAWSFEARK